jgi:hypothetical protein
VVGQATWDQQALPAPSCRRTDSPSMWRFMTDSLTCTLLQGGSPISTASWLRNGSHSNDYSSQTLASIGLRPSGSLTGQLPGASQVPLPAATSYNHPAVKHD